MKVIVDKNSLMVAMAWLSEFAKEMAPGNKEIQLLVRDMCQSPPADKMDYADLAAISIAGHIWQSFQNDGTSTKYDQWRQGVAVESYRLADELLAMREVRLNHAKDDGYGQES